MSTQIRYTVTYLYIQIHTYTYGYIRVYINIYPHISGNHQILKLNIYTYVLISTNSLSISKYSVASVALVRPVRFQDWPLHRSTVARMPRPNEINAIHSSDMFRYACTGDLIDLTVWV